MSAGRLAEEIGPTTRVVAFAHVSYLHGGRIDPAPIVEAAQRVGALTVVDGSQAAGAMPFDFGASGIDVYAANRTPAASPSSPTSPVSSSSPAPRLSFTEKNSARGELSRATS